eukprot:385507-Lingulodinium_polyedra.AAC.1
MASLNAWWQTLCMPSRHVGQAVWGSRPSSGCRQTGQFGTSSSGGGSGGSACRARAWSLRSSRILAKIRLSRP